MNTRKILLLSSLCMAILPLSSCNNNKSRYEKIENNLIEQEKIKVKLNSIKMFDSKNSYFENRFQPNLASPTMPFNAKAKIDINVKTSIHNLKLEGETIGNYLDNPYRINFNGTIKHKNNDVIYFTGDSKETILITNEFNIFWIKIFDASRSKVNNINTKKMAYFFSKSTINLKDFDNLFGGNYFDNKKYNRVVDQNKKTTTYLVRYDYLRDMENFAGAPEQIRDIEFGPILSDETNVLLGLSFKVKHFISNISGSILLK